MPELETKQVGQYTVTRARLADAIRRDRLAESLKDKADALNENYTEEGFVELFYWPRVAACTSPAITFDEFTTMPDDEALALVDAAIDLNPHWFETADPKN